MDNLQEVFQNMKFENDQQDTGINTRVLLIDGTNLFIRSFCAVPSMDDDGNSIGGIIGFLKSLGLAIRTFKPTRCIVVFDGKGGSQRRRKLYPQYKQNRKPPIRLNRAYDTTTDQQEQENMKWQLIVLIELLECLPVTIMALDNVEADDVIAHSSHLVNAEGGTSIIYSTDKDFLQLVSDNVKVYNPVKKKTFDVQQVLNDYGIHPIHFQLFRALNGDTSDNIKGISGVGEARLKKLLPEIADPSVQITYDYIQDKFANVKKVPKVIQNILAGRDVIELNMQLMDLTDGIMSSEAKIKVSSLFHNDTNKLQKFNLTRLLAKYRLLGSLTNYDSWIAQSFINLNRFSV